ncbi:hypothetical protein ABZ468_52720, partial [Streptomyces sp. NPDC005708]|uniref:hypothetical protein n=1 Tax=Streptomyces sp. NPDC005708 TaxID=3154564 RepID=UPI0033D5608E
VRGIEQDWSAVLAGVTLPWSTGVVEGTITKTILIKRRMYGRAGFPLLLTHVRPGGPMTNPTNAPSRKLGESRFSAPAAREQAVGSVRYAVPRSPHCT